MDKKADHIDLSVVIPIFNEAGNIRQLAGEIDQALPDEALEIIFVDDGSGDDTAGVFRQLADTLSCPVRLIRHHQNRGQSAAIVTGVRFACGSIIATLDGDCQNNPADIPKLLDSYRQRYHQGVRMIAGQRIKRQDSWIRRLSSRVANGVRSRFLRDGISDTGCGLKVFSRETMLALPAFDHVHRFLPAMFRAIGAGVDQQPVSHRPRFVGQSKYGLHNRLWVGISDLFGVRWLIKRTLKPVTITEEPK